MKMNVKKNQRGQAIVEYLIVLSTFIAICMATGFIVDQLGIFNTAQSESLRAVY